MTASSAEGLAGVLKARGHLVNPERAAVLRAFAAADRPVHAEQLWLDARRHGPVSRATVSRTLNLLRDAGVAELSARDGRRHYFSLKGAARRITLVDASAGAVRQIEAPDALDALHAALAQAGFALAEGVEVRVAPLPARPDLQA
ncbi:transcriptional repressor [uncultured Brevundimonas sp.]|uniref:transcriptional repressor n=1 Tax=uncultured Brevundimonas sp. TaxID=213418 RepID=UPI0025926F89|nr:transcriptional repressor [uncultured Brevundimonas sp.]